MSEGELFGGYGCDGTDTLVTDAVSETPSYLVQGRVQQLLIMELIQMAIYAEESLNILLYKNGMVEKCCDLFYCILYIIT